MQTALLLSINFGVRINDCENRNVFIEKINYRKIA